MLQTGRILLALSACFMAGSALAEKTGNAIAAVKGEGNVEVKIIAFNDLHGHLEAPRLSIPAPNSAGSHVPAGGAAYLGSAIKSLKQAHPYHAVVSAGDMIGASPLVSALFLDEPTIEAVNAFGIDFNAVGNHEFDKGYAELLRMQNGGCAKFTAREPCALSKPFTGANFGFLAANTYQSDGKTLFPATGIKSFGSGKQQVKIGFIGLTLKNTPHIVTPAGVAGLIFADEARTANALVPELKAQGVAAIVLVIHEGGKTDGTPDDSCPSLSGAIVPILERLDPGIDVVVSGHTHRAYICDYGKRNPGKPFLLTSAGQYGTLVTDIKLMIDPRTHKVVSKSANNVIVQGDAFINHAGIMVQPSADYPRFVKDSEVDAIVSRYADASASLSKRIVGKLTTSLSRRQVASGESQLGNLIADAQLAATQSAEHGRAQIALMNPGGVRADLHVPYGGGEISYGQIFSVQPFGNNLVVKSFSGAQLRRLLEQQFKRHANTNDNPRVLFPSAGFSYTYNLQKPAGSRVSAMRLHGAPIIAGEIYRVTINNYLANGGDRFSLFNQGGQISGGELDIDALETYLRHYSPIKPPATNRIKRID